MATGAGRTGAHTARRPAQRTLAVLLAVLPVSRVLAAGGVLERPEACGRACAREGPRGPPHVSGRSGAGRGSGARRRAAAGSRRRTVHLAVSDGSYILGPVAEGVHLRAGTHTPRRAAPATQSGGPRPASAAGPVRLCRGAAGRRQGLGSVTKESTSPDRSGLPSGSVNGSMEPEPGQQRAADGRPLSRPPAHSPPMLRGSRQCLLSDDRRTFPLV